MIRRCPEVPHLFDKWKIIATRIAKSKRFVMLFDFDGTLAPIAPKPQLARLPARTRKLLNRLSVHPHVDLIAISGRRRGDLRSLVKIRRMKYLGLYGSERNGHLSLPASVRSGLQRVQKLFEAELSSCPGVWIEPKGSSLSIHLLGARAENQRKARRTVENWMKYPTFSTHPPLSLISNLRDMEIVPATVKGKGSAVREVLSDPALRGALPVYFGDDLSDESAFSAIGKGIAIVVGRRTCTQARYYLRDTSEVAETLSRMEAILP